MSPPIICAKRRLITSPSPVPPYLREVEGSACENDWNRRRCCSGVMPIPLSATANSIHGSPWILTACTSSATLPDWVNFAELLSRLNRIWRTRVRSAWSWPTSGAQRTSSRFWFFSTSGRIVDSTSCTSARTSKSSRNSSILPASIFDRSSTSLISASRCLPAAWILPRSGARSLSPRSCASSSSISL